MKFSITEEICFNIEETMKICCQIPSDAFDRARNWVRIIDFLIKLFVINNFSLRTPFWTTTKMMDKLSAMRTSRMKEIINSMKSSDYWSSIKTILNSSTSSISHENDLYDVEIARIALK